jgi:hypothetical protein
LMRYWNRQKQMMHRKLKNKLYSTRDGLDSNLFFTWFTHSLTAMKSIGLTSSGLIIHLSAWHSKTKTHNGQSKRKSLHTFLVITC